jgi:hypothetical protein
MRQYSGFSSLLESTSEPIGFEAGDDNVRRYVGNRPLTAIDPSGLVEFDFTPDKVESMDWYRSDLEGDGIVGQTVLRRLAYKWVNVKDPCGKGGRVKITVIAEIEIWLDLKEIAKLRVLRAKAYGHEQKHAENSMTIIKREAKILQEVEEQVFESNAEAEMAMKEAFEIFNRKVNEAREIDAKHMGTDPPSPPAGEPIAPQGKMPTAPKGAR